MTEEGLTPLPHPLPCLELAVGLGWFQAFINGARVGDAFLEPAWTTYSRRTLYSAYDVTGALAGAGQEAVLGVTLGKGWRDPLPMRLFGAFDIRDALPVGRAAFIAWLLVVDGAGRSHNFTSTLGGAWRVGAGAVMRNNVYLGEVADLRILRSPAVHGWALPGFNDSMWAQPVLANTSAIGLLQVLEIASRQYCPLRHLLSAHVLPSAAATCPPDPCYDNICSDGPAAHARCDGRVELHPHVPCEYGRRRRARRRRRAVWLERVSDLCRWVKAGGCNYNENARYPLNSHTVDLQRFHFRISLLTRLQILLGLSVLGLVATGGTARGFLRQRSTRSRLQVRSSGLGLLYGSFFKPLVLASCRKLHRRKLRTSLVVARVPLRPN